MTRPVFLAAGAFLISIVCYKILKWRKNYAKAQQVGFPVYYAPFHLGDLWWLVIQSVAIPIIRHLPSSLTFPWLPMSQAWSIWKHGHDPFETVGSDTFILATPNRNMMHTCDPSIMSDLLSQRSTSHIPVEDFKFFEIYGPCVGTLEAEQWKVHRRVITTAFNAETNEMVWKESVHQASTLIDKWMADGSIVPIVKTWTSRLALNVLSSVLFNKPLNWDDSSKDVDPESRMSFDQALPNMLSHLGVVFMTPRFLLSRIPLNYFRVASDAFYALKYYMNEMLTSALSRLDDISKKKHKTILESIVLAGTDEKIHPDSMLGNAFFMLLAGQETAGNTLAFAILLLTIFPDIQHKLQAQLDLHFGTRSPADWNVNDYTPLQQGYLGAIVKEVLRLYDVVQFLTRHTVAPTKVTTRHGETHIIPTDTLCVINFAACFQHPELWPSTANDSVSHTGEAHETRALNFNPDRFLHSSSSSSSAPYASLDTNIDTDHAGPTTNATSNSSSKGGAATTTATTHEEDHAKTSPHFPFGVGARSCPGRLFALIEMTATLATIFARHRLVLVVSDATLKECGGDKTKALEVTRDAAVRTMYEGVGSNISLEMRREVPLRVVER